MPGDLLGRGRLALAARASRLLPEVARTAAARIGSRGEDHSCPCCGRTFGAFKTLKTVGPDRTVNHVTDRCPFCRSASRHRALMLYLERDTDLLVTPGEVLHFAPESGLERRFRRARLKRYVTTDLDGTEVDVRADITVLPFSDGEFDAVICSHVLEHIPDDAAALRELCRVVRPGGRAFLQAPVHLGLSRTYEDDSLTTPDQRLKAFGQADHVRLYGADLADRIRESGFGVDVVRYADLLTAEEIERFGVWDRHPEVKGADIYVAVRPDG